MARGVITDAIRKQTNGGAVDWIIKAIILVSVGIVVAWMLRIQAEMAALPTSSQYTLMSNELTRLRERLLALENTRITDDEIRRLDLMINGINRDLNSKVDVIDMPPPEVMRRLDRLDERITYIERNR